jgi:hypothetical protein
MAGALLMTAACMSPAESGPPEEAPVPVHGSTPGYKCDAGKAQGLVGQAGTQEIGARALQLSGARSIRWIRPGDVVTMDYREDRLNIELDERGRVKAVRCG